MRADRTLSALTSNPTNERSIPGFHSRSRRSRSSVRLSLSATVIRTLPFVISTARALFLSSFIAFGSPGRAISIAAADLNDDGFDEIVVGRSSGIDRLGVFDSVRPSRYLHSIASARSSIRRTEYDLGTMRSDTRRRRLTAVGSTPGSPVAVRGYGDLTGLAELLPLQRANRAFGIFVG